MEGFNQHQPEDYADERKQNTLAKYRRLSRILFYLTIFLALSALSVMLFSSYLLIALALAVGVLLTGVLSVVFQVRSGDDISRFPWLQNAQWSIMNRSVQDEDNGSERHA